MYQQILVPVDGSEPSDHALKTAIALARESGGRLRLLHIMDQAAYLPGLDPSGGSSGALFGALQDSGRQILAKAQAAAEAQGVAADHVFLQGLGSRLGDAVAKAATDWGADLIVVGTHGRSGPSRLLLGSGAEQIIRLAPVPVLVTR
jgi:nucleotide-binding universal stress UspA family protein